MSHPSWVCGLKPLMPRLPFRLLIVTPFVGVWIETVIPNHSRRDATVTPFVGVWIETLLP